MPVRVWLGLLDVPGREDVLGQAFTDDLPQPDGHGVADEPSDRLDVDGVVLLYELVAWREGLEDRSFPKGKRAILLRMTEATVPESEELCRDGG